MCQVRTLNPIGCRLGFVRCLRARGALVAVEVGVALAHDEPRERVPVRQALQLFVEVLDEAGIAHDFPLQAVATFANVALDIVQPAALPRNQLLFRVRFQLSASRLSSSATRSRGKIMPGGRFRYLPMSFPIVISGKIVVLKKIISL